MGFLSTTELADLQNDFAATLPDTCKIEYVTRTGAAGGGWTETWATRGSAIPCRLMAVEGRDFPQLTAAQIKEGRYWLFELHGTQTVAVSDRITKGSLVYQVLQTNLGQSELIKQKVLTEIRQ